MAKASKYIFIAEAPTEFIYLPYRQQKPQRDRHADAVGGRCGCTRRRRCAAWSHGLDPNLPIFNVRTMESLYRMRAVRIFNVIVGTVAAMGLMGLALSIVGLYGLVAYAAARRTREIGIRMAIGADRGTVLRMVLRQGVVLAVTGLAVGLVASVGAGEAMRAAFTITEPRDVTALSDRRARSCWRSPFLPPTCRRRAARLNPTQALRYE